MKFTGRNVTRVLKPFTQDILTEIGQATRNQYFPDNPLQDGRPLPFHWDEDRRAVLRERM